MTMTNVDIAIIGGGAVGLTLALALANTDFRIAIIEGKQDALLLDASDLRVSAINRASENILKHLGAWSVIDPRKNHPYQKMSVWEQDSFAQIAFDAMDIGQGNLGYIIENKAIEKALRQQVKALTNVRFFCPDSGANLMFGETEAWLALHSGKSISAKLVIGADGANSWVRDQLSIPLTQWDYDHSALVANIRTEEAHQNTARQIFMPEGPLAFLPLKDPHLSSIVWSQSPEQAERRSLLKNDEFNKELTASFDARLGYCQIEGPCRVFPLKMRYARDFALQRVALIGDAAHTIHPLAGQGLNLGLLDAAALAQTLIDLKEQGKDIGKKENLRSFERWRKAEAVQMIATMQGFHDLFSGENAFKKIFRGAGMMAVAHLPGVKKRVIEHALGIRGDLPKLAKYVDRF